MVWKARPRGVKKRSLGTEGVGEYGYRGNPFWGHSERIQHQCEGKKSNEKLIVPQGQSE